MTLAARIRLVLFIGVIVFVAVTAGVLLHTVHTLAFGAAWKQLEETASLLVPLVERDGLAAPRQNRHPRSPLRITVVDAAGRMCWDTRQDNVHADLHARPELAAALRGAVGKAEHLAPSLNQDMIYLALPLHDRSGAICGALRVALATGAIYDSEATLKRDVAAGACVALLLAFLAAQAIAGILSRPLERLSAAVRFDGSHDELPQDGPAEVRRLAAALNEAHRTLRHQDHMRREFVANASHELRTPVGALAAALEILDNSTTLSPAERDAFIRRARREADRLRRLASDLLDLSSAEEPVTHCVAVPADAVCECSEQAEAFLSAAAERGQSLHLQLPREPVPVDMTASDLARVVGNVLDNAMKYSPLDSRIELSLLADESNAIITITDNGAGIDLQHLERIFERFYRVDRARTRAAGGAGLGLSIARHLVLRRGGKIWAENRQGGGTAIHIQLPLSDPPQPSSPQKHLVTSQGSRVAG